MKMNIDIENYLSPEEIKSIVADEFRGIVRQQFNTDSDTKRILANIGYEVFYNILDKEVPNFQDKIIKKTKECVEDNDYSYAIFRKSNGWGDKDSLGYTYTKKAIEENKDIIADKCKEVMKGLDKDYLAYDISEQIRKWLFNKVDEG